MGDPFTWANNQWEGNYIQIRLDRFLVSNCWMNKYQFYSNSHLIWYSLDHYPILLWYRTNRLCGFKPKNGATNFEKIWISLTRIAKKLSNIVGVCLMRTIMSNRSRSSKVLLSGINRFWWYSKQNKNNP